MPSPPPAPVNSYDEVPYESYPYPQTHPSRLAVVATLFGLNPPPVATARVLELGCAAGGNLIPLAAAFPDCWCVGVDLSARQISDGERIVRKLGLKNVSLRHASITDVDESYGTFDYVICHGVFSWVPTPVREHVLAVCRNNLTPTGVGYVSYNTYPGWHMRTMIRDMMRYHAGRFETPRQRTQQARALLDFLAQSVRREGPYAALLKSELERLRTQTDPYLYHEHLEEVNDPVYFHQFVEMAGRHRLRYLGEANVGTMVTRNFGPEVEKTLKLLAADQIHTEQYMDFLRNRTFRETLLVREEAEPNWTIRPESVRGLHVASGGKPVGTAAPDVASGAQVQYQSRSGMTLSTVLPLVKAAMSVLGRRWPGTVPFEDLWREARDLLGGPPADPAGDANALALGLVQMYISSDLIEFHAAPVPVARTAGEKPEALPFAREQAAAGATKVANRRHEVVTLNDFWFRLLPLLDGTRARPDLVDRLADMASTGELAIDRGGRPLTDPAEVRAGLTTVVDQALDDIAARALLVG